MIFTRNATEAINLVANSWGRANLGPGDRVLLTELEHHSNIVPWYLIARERGAELDWAPLTDEGRLDMDAFRLLLERGPKLVAVAHVSNVLGTVNPIAEIAGVAHDAGALVLVDGAQAAPKMAIDVTSWAPTSTPSPATRHTGRPGSGSCAAAATCSRRWGRSWAADR